MKLAIIESPYGARSDDQIMRNIDYARECVRDALMQGFAPIASHLLYTQPGILNDRIPRERELGMHAGWAWLQAADVVLVYTDLGISPGMRGGIDRARAMKKRIERRQLLGKSQSVLVGLM